MRFSIILTIIFATAECSQILLRFSHPTWVSLFGILTTTPFFHSLGKVYHSQDINGVRNNSELIPVFFLGSTLYRANRDGTYCHCMWSTDPFILSWLQIFKNRQLAVLPRAVENYQTLTFALEAEGPQWLLSVIRSFLINSQTRHGS